MIWNYRVALILKTALCLIAAGCLWSGCARFEDKPLSADEVANGYENRTLSDPRFKDFLEINLHRENVEWPLKRFDFEACTLAAFYFHPGLDVARAQWASIKAGVKTAGGRPNPVLTVTPGYSANPPHDVSPWFPSVSIDVPIETAGKRRHRITQAEHLSESARLNIAVKAWQVRSGVRAALVEYAAARKHSELLERNATLQTSLVTVLEQRLAAGAASGPDVSLARIAFVKSQTDLLSARRIATEARGKIAEAIGVPLRGLEGVEFDYHTAAGASSLYSDELRRQALLGRSDIAVALSDYAAAQAALQLEIAKQYPDLHLNPGYQYDQGENKWALGLSVELPVLNRNQGPIAEAKARRNESAAKFLELQAKVTAEIDRAQLGWAAATEQVTQSKALLRAQQARFSDTEVSFKAGAADQFDLATARVELAAAEAASLDAQLKLSQAEGAVEDALQRPISALNTLERDPKAVRSSETAVSPNVQTKENR